MGSVSICVISELGIIRCLPLGVEHVVLLEDFGDDGNGGVDGVRDNKNKRFGGCGGDACREVTNNTCVDLGRQDRVSHDEG